MSEKPPVYDKVADAIDREKKFSEAQKDQFKGCFLDHYSEVNFSTKDVRLDRMTAEHFRVLDSVDIEFNRQDTILYGQNSQGKTSLVKSLLYNIAGLPDDPSAFDMTNLVKTDKKTMSTRGCWTIDDSPYTVERSLRQSGQGNSLSGDNKPYLLEGHSTQSTITTEFTDPSEVLEKFGLQQLRLRGHDPYDVLSLFFLMSEDFTRFLGEKHSELLDILFGINITTVVRAAEKEIDGLELSEPENRAVQRLREYQSEQKTLVDTEEQLADNKDDLTNTLLEKKERLQSIEEALSGQNELDRLRQRRNELQSRRADAKIEKSEVVEELASVRRRIERYEDTELLDDVGDIGEELQNFLTIPDRCPICTNRVDKEQREQLIDEHSCPLCEKEMPEDRYRTEVENVCPDKAADATSDQHREDLEELREKERKLKGEMDHLEQRIKSTEEEIAQVENDIDTHDLAALAEEQDELRRKLEDLQKKAVDTEVRLGSVREDLTRVNYEINAQQHLKEIAKQKETRRQSLTRFRSILERARDSQRQETKRQIANQIKNLFKYFNEGSLSEAHRVEFKSGGSYHFIIKTSGQTLDSSVADNSNAEINLHSLLFHTAVLKLLSESMNSPPIRLFIIDSPFDNEVDEQNANDIVNYLSALPAILPEYQVLIASADTDTFEKSDYENAFQLREFGGSTV